MPYDKPGLMKTRPGIGMAMNKLQESLSVMQQDMARSQDPACLAVVEQRQIPLRGHLRQKGLERARSLREVHLQHAPC